MSRLTRLFRQDRPQAWVRVLARVSTELARIRW